MAEKIWGSRSLDEVLAKRFKIFVLIGVVLIAISKLLYLRGLTPFPNFELIIPTLVVVGSFSLYLGPTKFWRGVNRYFGIIALVAVFLIDLIFWGPLSIYAFTWTGFILAWFLALQNKLSMFDGLKKLLFHTTLTAAIAILLFDVWTGIVGTPLTIEGSFWIAFLNQIPWTLRHLASLIVIPPLVGLGKMLVKVKVPVAVAARAWARSSVRR